ncbi:MAG: TIGR02147 family protein [Fibrobacter sp.]|nr:TIGR02147 family protein [Fibrobacter sp.]
MKPITEYQDYRKYMLDYFDWRKRTSAFSWREFSKQAGFSSPSYLKLVCDGKSSLSRVGVLQVAAAMNLGDYELEYFKLMVDFTNAKNDEKKKEFFRKMEKLAKEQHARVLNADAFDYYESAVNSIVRELAPLMPGALPGDLAKKIKHDFTAQEIRVALKLLVKLNFLKTKGENVYEQTDKIISGSSDSLALALRSMNRQMIDLAREAIDKIDPSERNISGVTVGVNDDALKRITEAVNTCRKQVVAIAGECDKIDQVYRLNLQLFPLSEKV